MKDDKRLLKWALVIVPVVGSILAIYPPSRKLKAGIDLAGGSSLLFEIDTSDMKNERKSGLAEEMMRVLKRRVDPNGQMNLVWRPIGNNRLEIQMPRPSRDALERREAFNEAIGVLEELNISKLDLERMLNASGDEREAFRKELAHGIASRDEILGRLIQARDDFQAGRDSDDILTVTTTRQTYEGTLEEALATGVNVGRLRDILALPNATERASELAVIKSKHPSPAYTEALDTIIARYDAWAKDKGALEDPSDLKRRIRGAGVLEFRILAERNTGSPNLTTHADARLQVQISDYAKQLQERGPRWRPGDLYKWIEVADVVDFMGADSIDEVEQSKDSRLKIVEKYAGKWFVLAHAEPQFGLLRDSKPKWKLIDAWPGIDSSSGGPCLFFRLDPRGGQLFGRLTRANLQRPMAIVLDDKAQSSANINSMIQEQGQIASRRFTNEKVNEIVSTLRAGTLPSKLIETPIMEQTIGPQLGEYNRTLGVRAAMYGAIAVAIFILIYYRFAGIVTNIALAMNLLFTLAIMATMEATFTLPGIAALILTVGMAVDANVLIFERIREERERGMGLRKAIRLGYDRALSTIVDANLTTLITCVVLGYVGTEEVKGFAMVLGFGIVTSMFTALFVTRLIFTELLDRGFLTKLSMMHMFKLPHIDWLSLRRVFWPVSASLVTLAVVLTSVLTVTNKEALFDIEFLGGTSVQFELKKGELLSDEEARRLVTSTEAGEPSACNWLRDTAAKALESATVKRVAAGSFSISAPGLTAEEIEALVKAELDPLVERGGYQHAGALLMIDAKADDADKIGVALTRATEHTEKAADRLSGSRIQTVEQLDAAEDAAPAFEVITVETNKDLVKTAILAVMGDRLRVERALSFDLVTDRDLAPTGFWPIEETAHYLSDVIEEPDAQFDIRNYKGGAVFVFDNLHPALSVESFEKRIREIRLQPEFSNIDTRPYRAIGLKSAGSDNGETVYSKVAYVVVDENLPYYEDPGAWEQSFAASELTQATEALATEKSLRKVIQFAPQIAQQTQSQAAIAIVLALAAIVAYIWIRFGQMQFGLAAIVALAHDVCITLGLLAGAHFVYNTFLGSIFGLSDFKIDLPMIAAFLTIIGYSLNDTIVVFDRIRENRGKLKTLAPAVINNSINQCLSRTVLTSFTTFIAVSLMYVFGGPGIHGFSFALLVGVVVGTYSSVGIATPLLHRPVVLHTIVYCMIAAALLGASSMIFSGMQMALTVAAVLIAAALIWAIALEMRAHRPAAAGA